MLNAGAARDGEGLGGAVVGGGDHCAASGPGMLLATAVSPPLINALLPLPSDDAPPVGVAAAPSLQTAAGGGEVTAAA